MSAHVLVADADPELADLIRSYLRTRGYSVDSATTGLECLERVRRRAPDVLVLCEELLGDGGDGVSPVLYDAVDSATPAVLLTTGDDSSALLRPQATSLVTCLRKPFRLAELARCIAAFSESQARSRPSDRLHAGFRDDDAPAS